MPTLPLLVRRPLAATAAAIAAVTLAACGDDAAPTEARTPLPFTVSGTLVNQRGTAIPADARVAVLWSSDDGEGDYAYLWGSGAVNPTTGGFTITFPQDPPAAATMSDGRGRLGVGLLVLVPAELARDGRVADANALADGMLGIATGHAVVFRDGRVEEEGFTWPMRFRPGFGVGRLVPAAAGQSWDTFDPTDAGSVRVFVDDLANLRAPNWS